MIETHLPNAMYADNRPDGEWVCSVDDTVLSSRGDLKPPGPMMFNRLPLVGPFKIAAKIASPGTCYVYENGQWLSTGVDSYGVQGHFWSPDGQLQINPGGPGMEPMGIRYWENGPVYGSPTYTPFTDLARAEGVSRLYEWTKLGPGFFVGQGDIGGTVIQHPQYGHRLLIGGDSRFIQAKRIGAALSIAVTRLSERDAVLFWLDEDEIAQLPVYESTAPDPEPEPEPEPEPTPVPDIPSQFAVVEAVNRDFPHLLQINTIASCGEFTTKVVERLRKSDPEWGFVGKTAGEGQYPVAGMPSPLTGVSYDVIFHRKANVQVDIIGKGTANEPGPWEHGPGTPIWNVIPREDYRPNNPWVASLPGGQPPPPPDPKPDTLQAQIDALKKELAELKARVPTVSLDGKRIALRTENRHFLCAEGGGGGEVNASREQPGSWETFEIVERR